MVATTMPTNEMPTTTATITSQSDQSSELAILNAKKSFLEGRQAGWEVAISVALLVTALAAVMVFVFDWRLRKASKSVQEVQDEIIRAKDAELQLSLKGKDVQIAELQRAGLPRNFEVSKMAAKLRPFKGTPLSTETLMEFEPSRTMNLIIAAALEAKWKLGAQGASSGMGMSEELARPGVWVRASHGPSEENGPRSGQVIRYSKNELAIELARYTKAAEALVHALNDEGITAHLLRPPPQSNERGVHIFVGLKPFPGMSEDLRVTIPKH
jgi:hypothetical protein